MSIEEPVFTEIDGKVVRLTNLSKVLFPEDGITKADLLQYYVPAAPVLLPHLRGRPDNQTFPAWYQGQPLLPPSSGRYHPTLGFAGRGGGRAGAGHRKSADLMWVVNQDWVELHPRLCRLLKNRRDTLLANSNIVTFPHAGCGLHGPPEFPW